MNDVPDQNASIAVPLSFLAMIGRATDSEVASRAACALKLVLLELEWVFSVLRGADEACSAQCLRSRK
jgi:hypothetical protein